jgi:predicted Zn-dependent protease
MSYPFEDIHKQQLTRRNFLQLISVAAIDVAMASCTRFVNPVTGKSEVSLPEEYDLAIDIFNSSIQFSNDYGVLQDKTLNDYISEVGHKVAAHSDRHTLNIEKKELDGYIQMLSMMKNSALPKPFFKIPDMPYSFRGLNAPYTNAYTFPAGSIAITRGLLLGLENEEQLAAVLAHELGHVNARHKAAHMGKEQLGMSVIRHIATSMADAKGFSIEKTKRMGNLGQSLGLMTTRTLLMPYTKENEIDADKLGMKYMAEAGYSPQGMIGFMEWLEKENNPNSKGMSATHPLPEERYQQAKNLFELTYRSKNLLPLNRERYMDNTKALRQIKSTIVATRNGHAMMEINEFNEADRYFKTALENTKDDYAALVMMAECQLKLNRPNEAYSYAKTATEIYPNEARAYHWMGIANMNREKFADAYENFKFCEQLLPFDLNNIFLIGTSLEKLISEKESSVKSPAAKSAGKWFIRDQAIEQYTKYIRWCEHEIGGVFQVQFLPKTQIEYAREYIKREKENQYYLYRDYYKKADTPGFGGIHLNIKIK